MVILLFLKHWLKQHQVNFDRDNFVNNSMLKKISFNNSDKFYTA